MTRIKSLRNALCATALTAVAFAASAAPVPTTVSQGDQCFAGPSGCIDVAADRSDINAINTADGVFFSLGVNGFITFDISPYVFGTPVFTIESTNGNPNTINSGFPESADLIFSGGAETVTISLNNQNATVLTSDGTLATGTRIGDALNQGGSWRIDLLFDGFDTLKILDTTLANSSYSLAYNSKRSDGFDIDFIDFKMNKVPEPGSLALLGVGLLGLVGASRRRKA